MSVQIWVLTVPRLASPRFLHVSPSRSMSVTQTRPIPVQVNVKIRMHAASTHRASVACHMYSCIPLCSDIVDAKNQSTYLSMKSSILNHPVVGIDSATSSSLV